MYFMYIRYMFLCFFYYNKCVLKYMEIIELS